MTKELEIARVRLLGPHTKLEDAESCILNSFNRYAAAGYEEIPIIGYTFNTTEGAYIVALRGVLEAIFEKSWVEDFNFKEYIATHDEPIWMVEYPGPTLVRYGIKK